MMKRYRVLTVAIISGVAALTFVRSAQSDNALTPSGINAPTATLDEIIVTAQKREQSINDVGMSITAVTGSLLDDLGVISSADLPKVVPGLTVQPPGANIYGAPIYTLRGVGFNEHSLAALSAVAFYQDEIPLGYAYMTAGPSLDVQRVEVLKGP